MVTDLLHIDPISEKTKNLPLFAEFSASWEFSPYLVTSTRSLFWTMPNTYGNIRAAYRSIDLPAFFMDVVLAVELASKRLEWGNVLTMSPEALAEGKKYILDYEHVHDVHVLSSSGQLSGSYVPDWLLPGYTVIVPVDRIMLGKVSIRSDGLGYAVIPHASRHMVILKD